MGQRLNLEIVSNGKVIANCYYHWKGFTTSSIKTTLKWLSIFDDKGDEETLLRRIFDAFYFNGARINIEDLELLNNNPHFKNFSKEPGNNIEGIVSISKKEIENTRDWEEGRVTIDVTNKKIKFDVWYDTPYEEYIEEENAYSDEKLVTLDDIKRMTDLGEYVNFSYEEFKDFARVVQGYIQKEEYEFNDNKNEIVKTAIE